MERKNMLLIDELAEFYGISKLICRTASKSGLYASRENMAELISFDKWAQTLGTPRSTAEAIKHFYGSDAEMIKAYLNTRTLNGHTVQRATRNDFIEKR